MTEQKDFGETRMFSPDAVKRFQEELNGKAAQEKRGLSARTVVLLVLLAAALGGLVWKYRAPIRHGFSRVFHHR